MNKVVAALFSFLFSSVIWASEVTHTITLKSQTLKESRPVLIRLPKGYDESPLKNYPVIFTLNDEDNFKWTSALVDIQSSKHGIEDMIVVGLPHTGRYSEDNYPFGDEEGSLKLNPQSESYSKFIRKEVIPLIDKNYRTNGGRFIVGHSLSGLFVAHLFTQYPNEFSTYIVLSPSLHYAPQFAKVLDKFFRDNATLTSQIYLSIGGLEHTLIRQEYEKLKSVFEANAPQGLHWFATDMVNTDHMLAAFNGVNNALAWIYKDWSIHDKQARNMSASEIINHYSALSKRLNYSIKPRKNYMLGLSGFLLEKLKNKSAALEVLKAANFFYEDSKEIKDSMEKFGY